MSEVNFKKGDVVQLKSGGPVMTVQSASYPDEIQCTWFDKNNKREVQIFDQETLGLWQ